MSVTYLLKRIISITLVLCISIMLLPVNASLNFHSIPSILQTAQAPTANIDSKNFALKEAMPISAQEHIKSDKTAFEEKHNITFNYPKSKSGTENVHFNNDSELTYENQASLNSLINQLGTTGINLYSVMGTEAIICSSGTDLRARVSYEISSPVYADYESSHTAAVKFKLNSPNVQDVSFDYIIYSGSASCYEHFNGTVNGTVTFNAGEIEKELTIDIPKLINNPVEYGLPSKPSQFWTKDRVLYINCSNISNALFDNEKESITVPVVIENQFDFKNSYQRAKDAYLADLSNLSDVTSFPETPGKFLNAGSDIKIAEGAAISGDVRLMIDTGVFSHINMPVGYFLNENAATGDVRFKIDKNLKWGSTPALEQSISVDGANKVDFSMGDMEISQIGLGPAEGNGIIQSLNVLFDYSALTQNVYTYFHDQNNSFLQKQMNFTDKINPLVKNVAVPNAAFSFGENIPITFIFNEPVLIDGISIKANGTVLYPTERTGTVSDTVSFLYEVKEDYANSIEITDVIGAIDLSGKNQEASSTYTLTDSVLNFFDAKRSFSYCASTTVNINQGENINAKGEVIISLKENIELSNWLADRMQPDRTLPVVKVKVIGKDGVSIEVPLYANVGPTINKLAGVFDAPANLSDINNYYAAEIYFADNISDEYMLLYSLSTEYTIPPIVYIDDATDFEIVYTNWPPTDKILANSETPVSLGYVVKNNATWQRPNDFSWSSSNETVAAISAAGDISLTGQAGTVTFTLTALNAGLTGKEFSIYSKTLEVAESDTTFLYVPDSVKNIEIVKGNNAKVYYSTNITTNNDSFAGNGTVTTFTYNLYEAEYTGTELQKGNLVCEQTLDATLNNNILSYTIDKQFLVNTSVKGKYSYILEISAKDLQFDRILTASANICVKELPAKAILSKPLDYYITDEALNIKVSFNIENKNTDTEYQLSVIKNEEAAPVFSANNIEDIDKEHTVVISAVDKNRLLDIYTVSLKAKNEFDEVYSYDSYLLYVYNKDALRIMVNGTAADNQTMSLDDKLSAMTSDELLALNRNISLTDEISINNKQYKWSNIADKITWEVSDNSKISLKYNDGGAYQDIEDSQITSFLPGSNFLLQGKSSGNAVVTAIHDATGMEAKLNVTVDKIEDKLYIFQVYPAQKSVVSYTNGDNLYKTVETDARGRAAVYEKSGIHSDVSFKPENTDVYDTVTMKYSEIAANQNSTNDFELYPQNNIIFPVARYGVMLQLLEDDFENESDQYYTGDVIIRGGVYRNGHYCPNTKINGISGNTDQTVKAYGSYILKFNPLEFTTEYETDPITSDDKIEYVLEVRFPDNSHYTKIIKINDRQIRENRSYYGVNIAERIRKQNPAKIQNNVSIVSQTVTIDGKEQEIPEEIIIESMPESAVLNVELMFSGYHDKNYEIEFVDEYNQWTLFSKTVKESYEFSDTVILRNTFDLRKRALYMEPGEKANLYLNIRMTDETGLTAIKLPRPVTVLNLIGIPQIDTLSGGALKDVSNEIAGTVGAPYYLDLDADDDQVKKSLDFLKGFSIDQKSIRLEIEPTDDPLVYKGIIKFAAGDLTRENPSGVYVTDESSAEKFNFMPGLSDIKAIKKGDYINKSKAQMEKNKLGSKGTYKTYGGGAYLESEIFYDVKSKEWKMVLLKSDVYLGAGGGYYRIYNTWVGPVPVTAEFRTGLTAQIGLKTVAEKIYSDDKEKSEYNIVRNYITELHPYFYIYGFGGFGADYVVASLKVGFYGQISLDQRYLWHNREEEKTNGQKITISGKTGVKFQASLLFVNYTKEYELGGVSKSWTFNDFDEIESIYSTKSNSILLSRSSDGYVAMVLEPVNETAAIEDRTYLNKFDRQWYEPVPRTFTVEDINIIQTNAYPHSNPVLTEDGKIMAYISDMGSTDIYDTSVCFSKKDSAGYYPEGSAIDASNYADTDVSIDGTVDAAAVVWTRIISDFDKNSGEEATNEDVRSMMSGTEIMASIYNGTDFTTTRLTNNSSPDMSPVVAVIGNKAIVAWRSLYVSDIDNPLNFDGRDNIMFSIFDGADWSEAKCLYDGSVDKVKALNIKMLSDGTSAITYQVKIKDTENTEIFCAVLDVNGNIVNNIRLTNNEIKDENPKITSVVFPDSVERFVIGWNTSNEEKNIIRLSAVNSNGGIYPQFEKEIENAANASNYNNFKFTKGAKNLEDLSIVWTEPKQETVTDTNSIYKDILWGIKFIQEDDGSITQSPKIKLLELDDQNVVDFFDSYTDSDTKEINFALLTSDYSGIETQSRLSGARSSYKNNLIVKETYFSPDDLLPGLDIPVLFSLFNEGVEPVEKVTINLAGVSHVFDNEIIKPGELKNYTVFYTVPETIVNPDYSVTAQFLTSADTKSGTLVMDVPDVGINNIDIIKELERERVISVQLRNNAFSKLKEGKHTVKLEVYDTPEFNNPPVMTQTFSDAKSLELINDGMFIQNATLSEEDLKGILDENGEIPEDGSRIYFNVIIEENGSHIDDADISNNTDYVKIHSLLAENGEPVSISSLMQAEADHTVVQVEALNNSMNEITNGNLIVNLRDQDGNIIETRQTYNTADINSGLITSKGEETFAATFSFNKTGASSDVFFSSVVNNSSLLSDLKLSGVPLDFDKNVYSYDLQVTDLYETFITIAAENPDSIISILKNGESITGLEPCTLVYGANTFDIFVKTGTNEVKYTVNIQNNQDPNNTYTLSVTAPEFTPVAYGYEQPSAKNIIITSSGNTDAAITSVELCGDNAGSFVIENGNKTVTAGGTNSSYTVRPIANLNAGTYTANITVAYNRGATASEAVTFTINKATPPTIVFPKASGIIYGNALSASKLSGGSANGSFAWKNGTMIPTVANNSYEVIFTPNDAANYDYTGVVLTAMVPVKVNLKPRGGSSASYYTREYENSFKDVSESDWYHEAVRFVNESGLMSGTSENAFNPNAKTTRGMLVTILYRMEHEPSVNASGFTDVEDGKYYAKAVAWAQKSGIVKGISKIKFAPNLNLTRQQLVVILYRYAIYKGYDTSKKGEISIFADCNKISEYAAPAMQWAVGTGLITGRSKTEIAPSENAARAEVAAILQRFIELYEIM